MSEQCQMIIFTNKAYNAIIRESFDKDPVETGGILLGHVLDNGMWIVMEVLPPGINSIFEYAYFEYDDAFVNYLAQSVANQYKIPLELLGLWHRHPGSMDFFSSTDDHTNATFAAQNAYGVISGLVNIDPNFRLTMYHLGRNSFSPGSSRPRYEKIPIEVGDDIIPEDYFELRYFDGGDSDLHPTVARTTRAARPTNISSSHNGDVGTGETPSLQDSNNRAETKFENSVLSFIRFFRRHRFILILILLFVFALSLKSSWKHIKTIPNSFIEWVKDLGKKKTDNKEKSIIDILVGDIVLLNDYCPSSFESKEMNWTSSSNAIVIKKDTAFAIKCGKAVVRAESGKSSVEVLALNVRPRKLTINKRSINIIPDSKDTLSVSPSVDGLTWASSDINVATVDDNGVVTAHSTGQCTISCFKNGVNLIHCSVVVSKSAQNPDLDLEAETSTPELISASLQY